MSGLFDEGPYTNGPVMGYVAITPADSDLAKRVRGFHVGVAGDVAIKSIDDVVVILKNCVSGGYYPYVCKQIRSTSTTATNIIGLY